MTEHTDAPVPLHKQIGAVRDQIRQIERAMIKNGRRGNDDFVAEMQDEAIALRAALATLESARWRPISEAPKDGTTIIVGRDMGDPWGFVIGTGRWDGAHGIYGWICRGFVDPPGELGLAFPDVWMPLPSAPPDPGPQGAG